MLELLLLAAIASAAARGIEGFIDDHKGAATPRHKETVAKVAAQKPATAEGKAKTAEPAGAPATFGRTAAKLTARTVAGGATWGRDAAASYRQTLADFYREEAQKARARRTTKAATKSAKQAAATSAKANDPQVPGPKAAMIPAPPAYPPLVGDPAAEPRTAPRLRVVQGGATPDTGRDLMTILSGGEITSLAGLTRYLRAVSTVSQINADTASIIADKDAKLAGRLDSISAQLRGLNVDDETVGEVTQLQDLVEAQASAALLCAERSRAAAEAAVVASAGAQVRHGSIAEAVADADLDTPAEAAYYAEGK
ncbi:hypothetical protein ACIA6C_28055 [Streptomyces sp. NPDC051578]|uniref:hypothetical protein n=1 Tax=Streptomyces sp. NPDC051578 TaxID=3365662 RepID=UPI0037B516AF